MFFAINPLTVVYLRNMKAIQTTHICPLLKSTEEPQHACLSLFICAQQKNFLQSHIKIESYE